jgi:catechol-2,3-dioxygenase
MSNIDPPEAGPNRHWPSEAKPTSSVRGGASLDLVALIVRDYDTAIQFFVSVLGFELVEDIPSLTNDGRPKRWV